MSGVGPKMALAVLSGMEPDEVVSAIIGNNIAALSKVPGVGKKTAERLVIEMRDRVKDWQLPAGQIAPATIGGDATDIVAADRILFQVPPVDRARTPEKTPK